MTSQPQRSRTATTPDPVPSIDQITKVATLLDELSKYGPPVVEIKGEFTWYPDFLYRLEVTHPGGLDKTVYHIASNGNLEDVYEGEDD